ncbi:MAG: hypothetical protein WBW71_12575 [Bacteroidota bacterium]
MTKEEYELFTMRYEQLNANDSQGPIEQMIALQEATFRTFAEYIGHEIIWEDNTAERVDRQRTFRKLANYGNA